MEAAAWRRVGFIDHGDLSRREGSDRRAVDHGIRATANANNDVSEYDTRIRNSRASDR